MGTRRVAPEATAALPRSLPRWIGHYVLFRNYRVGSLFGIPLEINPTWLLTLTFFIVILGGSLYPNALRGEPAWLLWVLAGASGLMFFASIIIHELAHSLMARRYGIPVRAITLFMLGGVSQITREAKRPFIEFSTAIVGPLTSFVLAAICFGFVFAPFTGERGSVVWEFLFLMNMALGIVNMAPGFPLDGGRVLRSAIWGLTGNYRRASYVASLCGRGLGLMLMGAGLLAFLQVLPWFTLFSGVWFILVGLFLDNAARQSWAQIEMLDTLRRHRADSVMRTMLPTVPGQTTLLETVGRFFDPHFGLCAFVVDDDERVLGMVSDAEAAGVPKEKWATTLVPAAMTPVSQILTIAPDADLATALEQLEAASQMQLPVVDAGRIIGYISRIRIMNLLAAEDAARGA